MSRTCKWEHKSDSYHTNHRLERQARPAGRIAALVADELAHEVAPADEAPLVAYIPAEVEPTLRCMWDDVDVCYVCGRVTNHVAEHDDLVGWGYAFYQGGDVRWTQEGAEAMLG